VNFDACPDADPANGAIVSQQDWGAARQQLRLRNPWRTGPDKALERQFAVFLPQSAENAA
jgi:hypothetical protein